MNVFESLSHVRLLNWRFIHHDSRWLRDNLSSNLPLSNPVRTRQYLDRNYKAVCTNYCEWEEAGNDKPSTAQKCSRITVHHIKHISSIHNFSCGKFETVRSCKLHYQNVSLLNSIMNGRKPSRSSSKLFWSRELLLKLLGIRIEMGRILCDLVSDQTMECSKAT